MNDAYTIYRASCYEGKNKKQNRKVNPAIGSTFSDTVMVSLDQCLLALGFNNLTYKDGDQ